MLRDLTKTDAIKTIRGDNTTDSFEKHRIFLMLGRDLEQGESFQIEQRWYGDNEFDVLVWWKLPNKELLAIELNHQCWIIRWRLQAKEGSHLEIENSRGLFENENRATKQENNNELQIVDIGKRFLEAGENLESDILQLIHSKLFPAI